MLSSCDATPTVIFLAIAKPEVGGDGGDISEEESHLSSMPESSSPSKRVKFHVK